MSNDEMAFAAMVRENALDPTTIERGRLIAFVRGSISGSDPVQVAVIDYFRSYDPDDNRVLYGGGGQPQGRGDHSYRLGDDTFITDGAAVRAWYE